MASTSDLERVNPFDMVYGFALNRIIEGIQAGRNGVISITDGSGNVTISKGVIQSPLTGPMTLNGALTVTGSVTGASTTAMPAGGTAGVGVKLSTTSNFGIFFGSGAPTLSAAQGSIYLRSDGSTTSTRVYVNTNGTTGWTSITTAT